MLKLLPVTMTPSLEGPYVGVPGAYDGQETMMESRCKRVEGTEAIDISGELTTERGGQVLAIPAVEVSSRSTDEAITRPAAYSGLCQSCR
jgi:hypothetical protein